jgi:hypothetical protein
MIGFRSRWKSINRLADLPQQVPSEADDGQTPTLFKVKK